MAGMFTLPTVTLGYYPMGKLGYPGFYVFPIAGTKGSPRGARVAVCVINYTAIPKPRGRLHGNSGLAKSLVHNIRPVPL